MAALRCQCFHTKSVLGETEGGAGRWSAARLGSLDSTRQLVALVRGVAWLGVARLVVGGGGGAP